MEDECDSCWWLPNDRCLSLSKPTPLTPAPRPAPPRRPGEPQADPGSRRGRPLAARRNIPNSAQHALCKIFNILIAEEL